MATTKNTTASKTTDSSKKGFAAMDDTKQKEAASKGGKAHGKAGK